MNEAEQKEYDQTRLRVEYNNSWPRERWCSPLQEELLTKMKEAGIEQVFFPLALNEESAVDVLFRDARLNRIVSSLFDLYDELPLRPDAAFDVAWRALEIVIHFYLKEYYPKALESPNDKIPASIEHIISCMTNSVFKPQLDKCPSLMGVLNRLIDDGLSESVLHYIVARMFLPGELQVKTQWAQVSTRCREILGKQLFDEYRDKYVKDDTLDAGNHRNAERLLLLILKGNTISLEHDFEALDLQTRITFILSGILYSSRCERFHGDYFSPLKSDRSTLKTYYGQYWLLTVSYLFFWMAVYKYLEKKRAVVFFTLENLADCIGRTIDASKLVMLSR